MKYNLTYLFLLVILIGCKPKKPTQLYRYDVIIETTNLAFDGSRLEPETKQDTVMAENDTLAYSDGLRSFLATKLTKDRLDGKLGRALSFKIVDSLGINLDVKLSKKLTDSLKKEFYKLNKDYVGAFD